MPQRAISMEGPMDVTLPMETSSIPNWQRKAITNSPFVTPKKTRRSRETSSTRKNTSNTTSRCQVLFHIMKSVSID